MLKLANFTMIDATLAFDSKKELFFSCHRHIDHLIFVLVHFEKYKKIKLTMNLPIFSLNFMLLATATTWTYGILLQSTVTNFTSVGTSMVIILLWEADPGGIYAFSVTYFNKSNGSSGAESRKGVI